MQTPRASRSAVLATLAWLALTTLAAACADKANPVMPPSGPAGPSGGGTNPATSDAQVSEAGAAFEDTAAAAIPDVSALPASCDLLAQNCPKPYGCYPANGVATCQQPGNGPTNGNCTFNNNPPDCRPGLTCIPQANPISNGVCASICDVQNATAACGYGILCNQPLPGFTKAGNVGYCQPSSP